MSKPVISLRLTPLKDGTCPLYITFRYKGVQYREPIDLHVNPDEWDPERRIIKGRGNDIEAINLRLQKHLTKANQIITDYFLKGLPLSKENFKAEFHSLASRECFNSFWEEEMNRQYQRRVFSESTLVAERRTLEKLRDFQDPLPFSNIDRKLIERFDEWHSLLLEKKGYDGLRERQKSLKFIKKYLLVAQSEGREFQYPFENFKFPKTKEVSTWLEKKEVEKLLDLYYNPGALKKAMKEKAERDGLRSFDVGRYIAANSISNIQGHLRSFLVSCFLGVRYSDLSAIRWHQVESNMLVFTPEKTKTTSGKTVYFPLTPLLLDLFLPGPGLIARTVSNQKANKQLKIIAELASIDKTLTTHVGRHTFGSLMVAQGVSLVSLMELMGVTTIRTVMKYAHSSFEQQKKELIRAQNIFYKKAPQQSGAQ